MIRAHLKGEEPTRQLNVPDSCAKWSGREQTNRRQAPVGPGFSRCGSNSRGRRGAWSERLPQDTPAAAGMSAGYRSTGTPTMLPYSVHEPS
jgi:hypothetical protein